MANNRLILTCASCKVGISIAKYYPSTPGWTSSPNVENKMDEFFKRHDSHLSERLPVLIYDESDERNGLCAFEHEVPQDKLEEVIIDSDCGTEAAPGWWKNATK